MIVVLVNLFFMGVAYKGYSLFRKFLLSKEKVGLVRDKLMRQGFESSVHQVRAQIVCRTVDPTTDPTSISAPLMDEPQEPPPSGVYQAEIHEFSITKKVDNTVVSQGSHVSSILSVKFTPASECESAVAAGMGGAGLSVLRGRRANSSKLFYAIEQGIFNRNCKPGELNCFWVEQRTADQVLVVGTWTHSMFEGEWLSCTGMRGKYTAHKADDSLAPPPSLENDVESAVVDTDTVHDSTPSTE